MEGHTVWVTVDHVANATREAEYAAAVAVLVRERTFHESTSRFPGVLWFNDQYLVDAAQDAERRARPRYPCTGAIIAVNRGDPVDTDPAGRWTLLDATYLNESYLITDPNEHTWYVDLWETRHGTLAWTVAIRNDQSGAGVPDDGACRGRAYGELPCAQVELPSREYHQCNDTYSERLGGLDPRHKRRGDHGMEYPCDGCDGIVYNAVLYFRLDHLRHADVAKDHREGLGPDWWQDAAACHDSYTNQWICPDDDDDREGNSHPYNPELPWPAATYDGRGNHGGSDACMGTAVVQLECHATRDVDIYYGYMEIPLVRTWWLVDLPGASAPYHCHDDMDVCGAEDVPPFSGTPSGAPSGTLT